MKTRKKNKFVFVEVSPFVRVFLLLIVFASQKLSAQTSVSLYVGQSQIVSAPNPPQGALYSVAWASRHSSVSVSNYGTYGGQITVNSYFTGTAQVQCDYYWRWYVGTRMYTNHATTYYNVTCRAVTLSVNPTSVSLNPGQGTTISYSLSPSISPTPTVRFYSNNTNVTTVNSNGYVYAVGPGSTTITVENSAGPSATCYVQVSDIPVTSVSVSSPISIDADEQKTLSATTYPSNATVRSKTWSIADGSEYISLTSSGSLTGKKPGTAHIYCTVNGSVVSNTATVIVSEPSFTQSSTSPANNATKVSAFVKPKVSYSLALYQGDNFAAVSLINNEKRTNVEGTASISGKSVVFTPTRPLEEQTNYTFTIPSNAVKNKWNTHYTTEVNVCFRTGEWEKLGLTASIKSGFISSGEMLTLKASVDNARIYYTLDGSLPTEHSSLYSGAIVLEKDTKLRAVAMLDGYKNSDLVSENYLITNVNVVKRFPDVDTKMYVYKDVNPYITYSNIIEPSDNLNGVTVIKDELEIINGDIIVADSSIFYIPETPLEIGCRYEISIPADAIKTWQGESNDATSWTFSTGDFATGIAMGGPELAMATKTDGTFQTWGMLYKSGNMADGSYSMVPQLTPSSFMDNDSRSVSSGYMHHAIVKNDGSLWMWGRQYCGEFGNNSTTGSAIPVKVMDGVQTVSCGGQTTAIIKDDGSLWMCGRNDFGQIGDSTVENRLVPIKIMDDVVSAVAGWCNSFAIKEDGSLWAWGRNDKYQLGNGTTEESWIPMKMMEDVAFVAISATESQWTAAIKTDGRLWVWGATQPSPTRILDNVSTVSVGADYVEAIKDDGTLWSFGDNSFGQLGNGTTEATAKPVKIMDNVSAVVSGGQTTMVNMQDGSVWTWGRNNYGTLGDGSTPSLIAHSVSPIKIIEGRTSATLTGIVSRESTYWVGEGSQNVIDALPVPLNAVYSKLTWESKNNSIVSVSNRGILRAEAIGETDVVATISNDKGAEFSLTCHVIVDNVTDINYINNSGVKIWVDNHILHIEGMQIGQTYGVYGANGILLYQGIAKKTPISIPIFNTGIYVVRVNRYSKKVLVH